MSDDSHDAPPATRRGHHMIPPFLGPRPGRHAAEPARTVRTPASPRAPTPLFTPPSTAAQHAMQQTMRRAGSDPAPAPGATDEESLRGAERTAASCEEPPAIAEEAPSPTDQIDPVGLSAPAQPADFGTPSSALVSEPDADDARGRAAWDVATVVQPLAEVGDTESDDDWFGSDDNLAERASADAGHDDASSWFDEMDDMNGPDGGTEAVAQSTAGGGELRACECGGIEGSGAGDRMHADIAAALERVAHRIRGGDVPLPADLPATSDAAALAAVLAALLRPSS
ncbi:MAG TPA: hypothetical protein VFW98_13665 [Gemmatimonadaceae bacterium]|nr:hypothetical protein [Gemmatimonadaceae bacterium]